ncbi:MAG: 30S ribosomal protein S17 [Nanoarchaeota archaeon]|nr:30S ribosomal protein S17 [Nanoarchaeota archaeon]MBU1103768.1 30S ribosomal protein S17 [Nanoarchaeota archaeon]
MTETSKKKQIEKSTKKKTENLVRTKVSTRGRIFQGVVTRKFPTRVAIEFERTVKIKKYERFLKKKTRIHARLPEELAHEIHIGDLIKVQECRPLSKMIHFIVVEKIRKKEGGGE